MDMAIILDFKGDEMVYDSGSTSLGVYLIDHGAISIQNCVSGRWCEIDRREVGELFGEVSFITGRTHSMRTVAIGETRLLLLPAEHLDSVAGSMPMPMLFLVNSIIDHVGRTSSARAEESFRQEKLAVVGRMANNIVHDLKSPFQMINLGAQMIESLSPDRQVQKLCHSITEQVTRMLEMANELGEYSRGQSIAHFTRVNLRSFINGFVDANEPLFAKPGLALKLELPDIDLDIDPDAMHRVFMNLTSNAIEAMPDGKGTICISATLEEADWVEIRFADNGKGIPEAIRDTLWVPFVSQGKKKGVGLGTSIIKSVVEGHGGSIDFSTQTNRGTVFTMHLPRYHAASA